jgi:hypothetical protein
MVLLFLYYHDQDSLWRIKYGGLTMRTIGGVEIKEGDELDILGKIYVLNIQDDLAGEFAVWSNGFMRIYATPNFEIEGVPVQIDYDCYNIAVNCYEGKIDSYEHYKQIVKEKTENLLVNLSKCKCMPGKEVGVSVPVDIEGFDFYLCTRCSGIIGKDEKGREDILTTERVVEEVNEMLDRYFEEKSQELMLKHGDISPDQTFVLDDAIEKIAGVIIQWAAQNQEDKMRDT